MLTPAGLEVQIFVDTMATHSYATLYFIAKLYQRLQIDSEAVVFSLLLIHSRRKRRPHSAFENYTLQSHTNSIIDFGSYISTDDKKPHALAPVKFYS